MKSILILAAFSLFSLSVCAETEVKSKKEITETEAVPVAAPVKTIKLTGSVMDDKNKETLVGAALRIDGKKYYSDLDGNFCIPDLKQGKHQIEVILISYQSTTVEIDTERQENIDIYLRQN